jgi:hypothetical protein
LLFACEMQINRRDTQSTFRWHPQVKRITNEANTQM